MAINFPEDLDSLTNPQSTDSVQAVSHAAQHADVNDAIEALEAKVGVDGSTVITSLDYRIASLEGASVDTEAIQDIVAGVLEAGSHTNITVTYDDVLNKINLASTYGDEQAMDAIATALTAGTGISKTYDDVANTITIAVDTTSIATQSYVATAISNLVDSAPGLLDTLNEIAAAIGDDANFATTITNAIAGAITTANEYTDEAVAGLSNSLPETYVPISDVASPDGVASLNASGKVPDNQLDINERIQDVSAKLITDGTHTNISVSYDDVNQTLNFTSEGGASVSIVSTAPASPSSGDLWLDSDTAILYAFDGSFWVEISGTGGGGGGVDSAAIAAAISSLIDGAPGVLDTLNELAAAIGDDSNFVTTITNALALKAAITDIPELAQDAIGNNLGAGLSYNDTTGTIGVDPGAMLNQIVGGTSGNSYGLVGTSAYLDVKDNNGYNKEIELDIVSVEEKLVTDGFAKLDSTALTGTPTAPTAAENTNTTQIATTAFVKTSSDAAVISANEYADQAVAGLGNTLPETYVPISDVGNVDGVASLNSTGKVPDTQLDIDERIQDVAAKLITDGTHTNISVLYDDINATLNLSTEGGGSAFVLSETAPATATEGDTWFNTQTGKLYVYYDSFWVEAVASGATGATGPAFVEYKGVWNSGISYLENDGVTYIGSLWRLNVTNSPAGTIPSSPNWQKIVHKGDKGDTGEIAIGTVETILFGATPTVTNTGTTTDAILNFEIPGGRAATVDVGTVNTVTYGNPLTIENSGTVSDAVFDFEIPAGRASTIAVGTVDDVLYGNPPTVVNSGDTSDAVFDFEIPAGRASTLTVGTVTTVLDGVPATVVNSGDTSDAVFDFEIPAGPRSTITIGTVDDVDFGTAPTVVNSGTTSDAIFDFELTTGRASTLAVGTVTTGSYASSVEIENVGTSSDAVFNFLIPQGIPGDFQPGETPPANPLPGQVWYNTASGRAYVYHDSFWVEFSPGFVGPAGSSVVNIVPAPATSTSSGAAGDISFDSSYVYICVSADSWVRIVRDTW